MISKLVAPSLMLNVKNRLEKIGSLSFASRMVTFTGTDAISGALVRSEAVRISEYHMTPSRSRGWLVTILAKVTTGGCESTLDICVTLIISTKNPSEPWPTSEKVFSAAMPLSMSETSNMPTCDRGGRFSKTKNVKIVSLNCGALSLMSVTVIVRVVLEAKEPLSVAEI